ncbi:uncharacterized protein LOC141632557 [Silene latifolia]|uniref:uncharacterized protein LOC141632557 n=1 Tax=Silene latifolia TaxID=37657 RepID=UPI003D78A6A5
MTETLHRLRLGALESQRWNWAVLYVYPSPFPAIHLKTSVFESVSVLQFAFPRCPFLGWDITAIGSLFTWNNKQKPEDWIYSRIDRFLVNKAWCDHLPDLYTHFLPEGTHMFKMAKNLKMLKPALKQLNRDRFSDIENSTDFLQKKEQLGKDPSNVQLIADEYEASKDLRGMYATRASFLTQKAKHQWVQQGDTNSSYFHGLLKKRRNGNKIVLIEDMNGKLRPVTGKEIMDALFSIPDTKSPGPDGYTSRFFKDAWEVIGEDIINAYRPIACCNVIYEVISKLLCARLAEVLPSPIDQNQGAFIQNRSIQENIMICQDLIRLYERPNATPRCLFKIDLQKAYDTVEWSFVAQLLDMFKFPDDFKDMVMQCIITVTFSLSINGDMFGYFHGKRGLRQGDPLSPLIFTLCMEYLTRTLKYAAARFNFHYHPLFKQQKLASMMFADDVLLFSRGDTESMMLLLKSFSTFSKASGPKVSASKSNAYFKGVPDQIKHDILRVSGFVEGVLPFKLVLVQSVLSSLHSYWASMFVLPKGIIARIEASYRNFLWDNSADYRRVPLVAWDKQNYLKGKYWIEYKPTANSSWVWRRISKVKQEMILGYVNGKWVVQGKGFSPVGCYEWFKGSRPKVPWARLVWNEWVVPKHQFLRWLIAQGALRTNDKLVLYGMDVDDKCYLCAQATEGSDHLFFECAYSKQIIHCINQKLDCHIPENNVLDWCLHMTGTKLQIGVHAAIVWGAIC